MSASPDTPLYAELWAFVGVAQALSFVRAAQQQGREPTALSRRVQALERRLGVRLIERTTRSVTLTEAGARYLLRAREILRAIDEADREASAQGGDAAHGHLRLALPDSFGRLWLAPLIAQFLAEHPHISIEAQYANRFVDLVGERFDMAVRLGELADSRLVARRIGQRTRMLCAAPAYLAQRGTPKQPEELAQHDCLIFSGLPHPQRWDLAHAQAGTRRIEVAGRLMSDDAESLVIAARAGLGIVLGTDWLFAPARRAGQLVRVLPDWRGVDEGAIYLVTPSGPGLPGKTRVFGDWLAQQLAQPPWALAPD